MKVLVTGGAGFIGANLCRGLEASGLASRIIALDDLSSGHADNLRGSQTELVLGSILDQELVGDLVRGVDAVVHLAARGSVQRSIDDPLATHRANVNGTLTVLEACRSSAQMPHVLFSSSSSVYGANPVLPKHEQLATLPMSPYAASKLAAESYVLAYQRTFGLDALAFRFFNVYGPGQRPDHDYAAVLPRFIDATLRGEAVTIYGNGLQSRDFTYVGTVVDVLIEALRSRTTHSEAVNLAFGTEVDLLQALAIIRKASGRDDMPEPVFRPERTSDVRASSADSTTLRRLFPDAVPVPLQDGIAQTVSWMVPAFSLGSKQPVEV